MRNYSGFLIPLFILLFAFQALGYDHPGAMHPTSQIEYVRKKIRQKESPYAEAFLQLVINAEAAFGHETHALADFNVPGYYIDPAMHRKNSAGFQSDAFDAYACALAYQLGGKVKYAEKSIEFLMAWANLNTSYSNNDGSLVMSYSGTAMIMAAELLAGYSGWKTGDRQKFNNWVALVYRKATNEIRTRKNNWGDWGRLGSILSAYYLDDSADVKENIRLIKSDLIHKIADYGHMPEETMRVWNGIWYTYFSLAPITAACWVAWQAEGVNIFELKEGEKSIRSALKYLFHFNQHPDQWQWFKNPRPGSPSSWPGNLFEAMSGIYDDREFSDYVKEARPVIIAAHHFAWSFPTLMKPLPEFIQPK